MVSLSWRIFNGAENLNEFLIYHPWTGADGDIQEVNSKDVFSIGCRSWFNTILVNIAKQVRCRRAYMRR
ncbi:Uncharacterised protein [Klebsiella pneumoniae]|nr:Uncharacterised protein [Klebsiella pneumoniae]